MTPVGKPIEVPEEKVGETVQMKITMDRAIRVVVEKQPDRMYKITATLP